jgi:hypothetical protein
MRQDGSIFVQGFFGAMVVARMAQGYFLIGCLDFVLVYEVDGGIDSPGNERLMFYLFSFKSFLICARVKKR